ncbi:DUF6192 family protein [Streptomyces sp. NPDC101151]|uniref:DUF6192 family protein n=1 Tax=Streptomyces sp. NPDC101151 TaxID=3366115 RepID=UPI0038235AF2
MYRHTAARWPAEHRAEGVSCEVHRILERLGDRFELIQNPPRLPGDGRPSWTQDAAKRLVGWRVESPQTAAQEKVERSTTWRRTTRSPRVGRGARLGLGRTPGGWPVT